ncbi:MAG: hypothetical protein H8E13_14180 [Actinobacteria bacterium]|nr:hypothetical protein [Actinomycetota bacterium]
MYGVSNSGKFTTLKGKDDELIILTNIYSFEDQYTSLSAANKNYGLTDFSN